MIKVAIIGVEGRMGAALHAYIPTQDDLVEVCGISRADSISRLLESGADCAVDLSNGEGVDLHGADVVNAGIPYIIGATGYSQQSVERMAALAAERGSPVLIAPNFSIGANLMILFAKQAAAYMDCPVVTERHHERKADAPSGTARYTAAQIADARSAALNNSMSSTAADFSEQLQGVLGADADGVAVHSIRGAGYLAEQQVIMSLPGESLTIEHRSIDRRCFMPGIAWCIRNIGRVKGLVIGMERIMEL